MRARTSGATRALVAVSSATLLGLALFVQTASAGLPSLDAPLTVVKVVDGVAPAGTTFTATITCDDDIIGDGEVGTDTATVTFDATGQPTSADTIGFRGPGVCTVTETANGGATTVAYGCEGVQGTIGEESDWGPSRADILPDVCATTGPTDPIEVNISEPDQSATVTITNTFTAPTPPPAPPVVAPAVVAQPAFTG
jgi:hypothetical protein